MAQNQRINLKYLWYLWDIMVNLCLMITKRMRNEFKQNDRTNKLHLWPMACLFAAIKKANIKRNQRIRQQSSFAFLSTVLKSVFIFLPWLYRHFVAAFIFHLFFSVVFFESFDELATYFISNKRKQQNYHSL